LNFARATIAGAGLAGLSAAVALRRAGLSVEIAESAAHAGGRCRSYFDPQLGQTIDNGNHLVLSGNPAVARFRETIGAAGGTLVRPDHADFAFYDVSSDRHWTVRINDGRAPWWIGSRARRVPGSGIVDYLPIARLLMANRGRVDEHFTTIGPVWDRFLEPILLAVLNTEAGAGSALLTRNVLRETVAAGGLMMRPLVAESTLAAAFIDPAVAWLARQGISVAHGRRLRGLGFERDRVASLDWGNGAEPVADDEAVILAVPPWVATDLVPDLQVPTEYRAILNGHFALSPPPGMPPMLGVLGGTAEWIFAFPDRISVTVSAADRLIAADREQLAQDFWADICRVLDVDTPMPAWQIVKEKRATFAATPEQDALRPPAVTPWRNLFLAGDWTQTGLPATIEGALRSGETAARLAARGGLE